MFSILLGLAVTIVISTLIAHPVQTFITRFQNRALSLYPPDLVVTVTNGEVTTNVQEPLRFPIPFELFTDVPPVLSDQNQLYLVTIDTSAEISDFDETQSAVLITKDTIVAKDDDGFRVYPLDKETNVTIDKGAVDDFLSPLLPKLSYVPALLIVLIGFALIVILPLIRLVWLFFPTLALLLLSTLLKLNLSYGKLYQIGLHALTLPTLIQLALYWFGVYVPLPFFGSILYILYALVILATLREKSTKKRA